MDGDVLAVIIFYGGALVLFILWIWALIDILVNDFKNDINKVIWLLVVFFFPAFGSILYIFIGLKQKKKKE